MNLEISKRQIIYDIILCQEDWVIKAISQLLQFGRPQFNDAQPVRAIESKRMQEEEEKKVTQYDFMSVDEFMDMMRKDSRNA
ncbi:MAG: hypothetical protein JNM44_03150 [Chitinophagaceae bacterium]|nr:hypothetical protein [Chitinophagaceae bacterium]